MGCSYCGIALNILLIVAWRRERFASERVSTKAEQPHPQPFCTCKRSVSVQDACSAVPVCGVAVEKLLIASGKGDE